MYTIRNILFMIVFITATINAQTDSVAVDLGKDGLFIFVSTQSLSEETPDERGAVKANILKRESSSENFEEIGIAQMATNVQRFLEIVGVDNSDTVNNVDSIWTTLKQNPMIEDYGFDAINPNFLIAMGAGYYDKDVETNSEYQYKVEYLDNQNNVVKEAFSKVISPSEKPIISQPKFDKLTKSDSSAIITWKAPKISEEESFFADLFYQVNGEGTFKLIDNIAMKRESDESFVYQTILSPLEKGNYYKVYIQPKNFLDRNGPSSDTTGFFFVDYNKLELMGQASAKDSTFGVYLSWQKIEQKPYYSGLEIKRSKDLVNGYTILDTVSISQTDYHDTNVEDKQTYHYRFTPLLSEEVELPFQASASVTYTTENDNLIPPYNLAASKKGSVVTLSWNSENDPFGYNVYRSGNFKDNGVIIAPNLKESAFVDTINNLTRGRDYVYYVTSINEANKESPVSNKVSIKLEDKNNTPPTIDELNGYAEEYRIRLTWENLYEDFNELAGFNIYKKSSTDKNLAKINDELISPNFFDDAAVASGETYTYHVTAVSYDGVESEHSNQVKFSIEKPDLSAPQRVNARSTSKGIELSWSAVIDESVVAYKIYRQSDTNKNRMEIGVVKANETTFVDSNVVEGKLYHYSVKTESANRESDFSPVGSERYLY
ncbi:MAG: hypothetical protein U5K00_23935 [Melioribacteraceae bacterium]|nr:hypothetical protein [Melioribacteraceae bacterium]